MSQDRDGNVVIMGPLAKAAPRSLVKCGRVSEMLILALAECEGAFQIVRFDQPLFSITLSHPVYRRCERESNRKLGVKVIVDLDGFNMDLVHNPAVIASRPVYDSHSHDGHQHFTIRTVTLTLTH